MLNLQIFLVGLDNMYYPSRENIFIFWWLLKILSKFFYKDSSFCWIYAYLCNVIFHKSMVSFPYLDLNGNSSNILSLNIIFFLIFGNLFCLIGLSSSLWIRVFYRLLAYLIVKCQKSMSKVFSRDTDVAQCSSAA